VVFLPLLAIYLLTMDRSNVEQGVDAVAGALPAWRFTQFGDIDMSQFTDVPWIVDVDGRLLSNRPPGVSWVAVPFYWLFGAQSFAGSIPSLLPATATAASVSAGAVGVVHLVLRRVGTPTMAALAALAFGLGTSTWSVSANELWAHGPAQLFLALGLLALSANRFLAAGVAHGAALLVRPVTALIAAGTGLIHGWMAKSWRPVLLGGLGAGSGLAVLMIYNRLVLNTWSPVPAAYGETFIERAQNQSLLGYVGDLLGMFLHPRYSVFVFSPFLLFTVPGLREGWKKAPPWVRASALAGGGYMLIHLRLNRFWGGAEFNYRYPLEMLTVMTPLLFLSWRAWFDRASDVWRRLFWYSVVVSVAIQCVAIWIEFSNPTVS
jgi:4-amino-4-deoxy-L-arabinose transferase-like glycosyltransferase